MRQGRDRPRQLFAGPDQFEEEKVPNGDQIIPSNANSASQPQNQDPSSGLKPAMQFNPGPIGQYKGGMHSYKLSEMNGNEKIQPRNVQPKQIKPSQQRPHQSAIQLNSEEERINLDRMSPNQSRPQEEEEKQQSKGVKKGSSKESKDSVQSNGSVFKSGYKMNVINPNY